MQKHFNLIIVLPSGVYRNTVYRGRKALNQSIKMSIEMDRVIDKTMF